MATVLVLTGEGAYPTTVHKLDCTWVAGAIAYSAGKSSGQIRGGHKGNSGRKYVEISEALISSSAHRCGNCH